MTSEIPQACPDERLAAVLEIAAEDVARGLGRIEDLLREYPDDPQLHYLAGALLASGGQYGEAMRAMSRALAIRPDFAIARLQLGLLALSSGDGRGAQVTLEPLHALAGDDPLRNFAEGLSHLAGDRFEAASESLRKGILLNDANAPLNRDMKMILDRVEEIRSTAATTREEGADETSPAQMLLAQALARRHLH